jgi:Uma2 family endonuclease
MSLDQYLAMEETSSTRHEYVAGEAYAMSGVTTRHNIITLNVTRYLHRATRARGCKVFATDVRLRAAVDRIYYPDVIVACGSAAEVERIIVEPSLVVEVTSASTGATDRREKLDAYLRIPSLRVYLIVEQRRRHVLAYTREANGEWRREEIHGEGAIALPFLDAHLTIDEIYEDVTLPPLSVREGDEWDPDEEWAAEAEADRR